MFLTPLFDTREPDYQSPSWRNEEQQWDSRLRWKLGLSGLWSKDSAMSDYTLDATQKNEQIEKTVMNLNSFY